MVREMILLAYFAQPDNAVAESIARIAIVPNEVLSLASVVVFDAVQSSQISITFISINHISAVLVYLRMMLAVYAAAELFDAASYNIGRCIFSTFHCTGEFELVVADDGAIARALGAALSNAVDFFQLAFENDTIFNCRMHIHSYDFPSSGRITNMYIRLVEQRKSN